MLASYSRMSFSMTSENRQDFIRAAVKIARDSSRDSFAERWGACHFLCVSDEISGSHLSRWIKYQAPLLQSLLAPALPVSAFAKGEAVELFLHRSAPEPGLAVCSKIHELGMSISSFGLSAEQLPSQVANTLMELGVIISPGSAVDPIAEILYSRYGTPLGKSWFNLLKQEYTHALGLLKQADSAYAGARSFWLACQNSFNQTIFLALQRHLASIGDPGSCKVINKNGELIEFGVTLDVKNSFSSQSPNIADCFRKMNSRRNHLPVSHPYEKKTAIQSRHLEAKERNSFVSQLRTAYADFVKMMP